MQLIEVMQKIEREAAKKPEIRRVGRMAIGAIVRQGDLYLMRVNPAHPHGEFRADPQLVRGTMQGARHVAAAPARVFGGIRLPPDIAPQMPLGPCVVAEARWMVEHPEHAHISLPAGTYQTWYQLDPRTMLRVGD